MVFSIRLFLYLYNMALVKLSKLERKRISVIFLCFLLAICAWVSISFNKTYSYEVETALNYIDAPKGKAYRSLQNDTINLVVEGSGWQLLFARLRISPQSIDISLKKLNHSNHIVLSEQLSNINKQLASTQKVISVSPDTLMFDFAERISKQIPLKLLTSLSVNSQYGISGASTLLPPTVTITGSKHDLEQINWWNTDSLKLVAINKSVDTTIGLNHHLSGSINIFPEKVRVKIPVDEFTEKEFVLPIQITNNTDFEDVELYPKHVKVILKVALRNYANTRPEDIKAEVDLALWQKKGYTKLPVKLSKLPAFSKLVSVSPSRVDFLVLRNRLNSTNSL